MIDNASGQAVGLIDLDTVKPGLVHYDIGDCLRSCCNRLGEETLDAETVSFDLNLSPLDLDLDVNDFSRQYQPFYENDLDRTFC